MMDIFLENTRFYYVSAKAILWIINGMPAGDNEFKNSNFNYILKTEKFKTKSLYINFKNLKSTISPTAANGNMETNAAKIFVSKLADVLIDNPIIFLNLDHVDKEILIESIKINDKLKFDNSFTNTFVIYSKNIALTKAIKNVIFKENSFFEKFEREKIKSFIESSYTPKINTIQLISTAISTTGEFDAFKLITSNAQFIWISILLSDLIIATIDNVDKKDITILSVSLRGSIFGGAIAGLCNLNINTIDHLGPKFRIIDVGFAEHLKNKKFIFIGDFVIGGTEIKISQAYVKTFGGDLHHAFCIGSMLKAESYKSSFKLSSLYSLQDFKSVKYTIGK